MYPQGVTYSQTDCQQMSTNERKAPGMTLLPRGVILRIDDKTHGQRTRRRADRTFLRGIPDALISFGSASGATFRRL